jgi:hypothetical protein
MTESIRRFAIQLGALALLVVVFGGVVGAVDREPDLSEYKKIRVEEGHRVSSVAYAEGVQIYRWNGTAWVFVAPEAFLYSGDDEDAEVVGTHYAGPTWESNSGSYVVAALVDKVTPDPTAIPWLLLKAKTSSGPGIFNNVTFIQRLFTTGGLMPSEPGEEIGEEMRVPYTAWYFFYKKQ